MLNWLSASVVRRFNAIILSLLTLGLVIFSFIIGYDNYNRTIEDLDNKAKNTAELSSIALREPIWNIDDEALESIVKAIMLDTDVVGLAVYSTEDEEPLKVSLDKRFEDKTFSEVRQMKGMLITKGTVHKEDTTIGQVEIITTSRKANEVIEKTSTLIAEFAVSLLVILGFLFSILANKFIKKPIWQLKENALQLADGNLSQQIDTSRKDELGSLARSFARMRDAIRKKIADLHLLNTTGEVLAGMHDQTEALKTAIRVMEQQTNVTRGSIYLLNDDNELEFRAFYPDDPAMVTPTPPRNFKMGEGIAGQSAAEKKVIYIPDTSKDNTFITGEAGRESKALLCVPMLDNTEIFGVMNFTGEVGKVQFERDDEEFSSTIARLTVVTTKNIQMLNVIEEQNRNLEQKVLERTSQLRQKTNDINSMLQNMHQGIFTIIDKNVLHPEYSSFLESILEEKDLAGRNVMDVLFGKTNIGADLLNQIETAISSLMGEDVMMFDFNQHLLVSECQKVMHDGRIKILEMDWDPITNDEDVIEKMMVTVRDVTELRGLQEEAEKQKQELEIIGQILAVSQKKFQEFVKSSNQFIEENEQLIKATEEKNPDVLATLFRNMHTIKGNARTYGFKHLTDKVHEAEHTYDKLRKETEAQWDKEHLLNELYLTAEQIKHYENVYNSKLGKIAGGSNGVFIEDSIFNKIIDSVSKANKSTIQSLKQSVEEVEHLLSAVETESMSTVLEDIVSAIPDMARELEKPAPKIDIVDNNIRVNSDVAPILRDVFIHSFRNSMDHGLERPEERKAKGKQEQGTIRLEVSKEADKVVFRMSDDGRGLNLGALKNKALEAGVISDLKAITDEDAAKLIFHSGLSTAKSVTGISGRGVGMDAIKRFLNRQKGDIALEFTSNEPEGSEFRQFCSVITLPADQAVQV